MPIESCGRALWHRHDSRLQISFCIPLAVLFLLAFDALSASAKTPGKTYCFHGTCHRVLTLAETRDRIGKRSTAITSFYRHCKVDRFNPCGLTSSGAVFRPSRADNAASPVYPNGTKLLVWNPANLRAAVVRIDNAGPYWGKRTLDLSRAAAEKLGFSHRGVARLVVKVIHAPTRQEATYRRRRVYPPVQGYIGRHASIDGAYMVATNTQPQTGRSTAVANLKLPVKNVTLTASVTLPRLPTPLRIATVTRPVPGTFASSHQSSRTSQRMALGGPLPAPWSNRLPARLAKAATLAEIALPLPQQAPAIIGQIAALDPDNIARRKQRRAATRRNRPALASISPTQLSRSKPLRPRNKVLEKKPVATTKSSTSSKPKIIQSKTTGNPKAGSSSQVHRKSIQAPKSSIAQPAGNSATIAQPKQSQPPTAIARPLRRWRGKYFGVNPGGA